MLIAMLGCDGPAEDTGEGVLTEERFHEEFYDAWCEAYMDCNPSEDECWHPTTELVLRSLVDWDPVLYGQCLDQLSNEVAARAVECTDGSPRWPLLPGACIAINTDE